MRIMFALSALLLQSAVFPQLQALGQMKPGVIDFGAWKPATMRPTTDSADGVGSHCLLFNNLDLVGGKVLLVRMSLKKHVLRTDPAWYTYWAYYQLAFHSYIGSFADIVELADDSPGSEASLKEGPSKSTSKEKASPTSSGARFNVNGVEKGVNEIFKNAKTPGSLPIPFRLLQSHGILIVQHRPKGPSAPAWSVPSHKELGLTGARTLNGVGFILFRAWKDYEPGSTNAGKRHFRGFSRNISIDVEYLVLPEAEVARLYGEKIMTP